MRRIIALAAFAVVVLAATPAQAQETRCAPACVQWVVGYQQVMTWRWVIHFQPFLVCTRGHESANEPNPYRAVSASGTYRGAYQFHQNTWDNTARHHGRPDLVGQDPINVPDHLQDELALDLYLWQGNGHWGGRC